MKSFVAYPLKFETILFPEQSEKGSSGKLIAHYELFKKVRHLNGSVVKCGITAGESFSRFTMLKEIIGTGHQQKMIAFERFQPVFEEAVTEEGDIVLSVKERCHASQHSVQSQLIEKGISENINFVPGAVSEAIPQYLMENPEFKISMLNIDLDEYDTTLTTLEFLYPRLMPGGILVIDNFFKYRNEYKAVKDYFAPSTVVIHNFSVNNGPHYIVKP